MLFKKFEKNPATLNNKNSWEIKVTRDIIKSVYRKSAVNIKLNEKKLKTIPQKSKKTQGCIVSPYLRQLIEF